MKTTNPLRRLIGRLKPNEPAEGAKADAGDSRVAVCALFLEMARADGEFSHAERRNIISILKDDFHLSDNEAQTLIEATDQALEKSIDLWQFTRRINQSYSDEEKIEIIQLLWKIVYADGSLEKHENYLVHKLSNLLHLSHKQLIDAKLKVIREGNAAAE